MATMGLSQVITNPMQRAGHTLNIVLPWVVRWVDFLARFQWMPSVLPWRRMVSPQTLWNLWGFLEDFPTDRAGSLSATCKMWWSLLSAPEPMLLPGILLSGGWWNRLDAVQMVQDSVWSYCMVVNKTYFFASIASLSSCPVKFFKVVRGLLTPTPVNGALDWRLTVMFCKHFENKITCLHNNLDTSIMADPAEMSPPLFGLVLWHQFQLMWPIHSLPHYGEKYCISL